ncbi:MAG: hypothetical protein EPN23_00935 [Verrucomicrobia bacterium]|nr:MAG: hypothetical protein EPN23_00935 [Verrucomicrobiota bacterium]
MKRFLGIGVMVCLLGGCITHPLPILPRDPAKPVEPWPLAQGTRWIYTGTIIRMAAPDRVETNDVRLTCAVLESQTQRGYQVARLSNFPLELSPWEPIPTNAVAVLVRTPASEFHAVEAGQARHMLARLADPQDKLDDLFDVSTQVMAWPLRPDQRWGDEAATQRLDALNCWRVDSQRKVRVSDVRGIYRSWNLPIYQITYRTLPDQLTLQFAAHVGLLTCDYVHHGTPGEMHLKLVEFHQPVSETEK